MEKLSLFERVSLANQFRIRAKLEGDDHLSKFADILERGYVSLYRRVFEWIYDETPDAVGEEVQDIFTMYRALERAYEAGATPAAEAFHPRFDGFDGNHDPHFGIASFLIDDLNLWSEQKDRPRNSHSMATIGTYREMLKVWNDLGRPFPLTQDQVNQIAVGPSKK
ncbi:YfbU family protein [Bradyrhizobium sp. 180]|uniref:YfbU family protein n=1 Tax=Bradyrhizobium sp. 180 TaxID=2782650 RepID=UPI001FF8CBB2|nr:YfbU family protein [Bradyrhizobium sp. 180]MCK1493568.1 YfbU family protein [Bradyrhizobium sp. 180]